MHYNAKESNKLEKLQKNGLMCGIDTQRNFLKNKQFNAKEEIKVSD
ncbi:hypothetical protein HZA96_04795 [Candidatus Woesearchaeota archaeon]|nr:hypothetical protein [Candidatus Woesearchaeota archaeon]